MKKYQIGMGIAGALLLGGVAQAHHSGAMFAADKVVSLSGTVSSFEFTNPHSWINMVVLNDKGQSELWSIEMASPNVLTHKGWKPTTVVAGEKIQVSVHPLKDGAKGGSFILATLANGKTLTTGGGSGGGAPTIGER